MKAYRLSAWPDLDAAHRRIGYRRMMSDMSQRFVTLEQLATSSGLSRHEVREFIRLLDGKGILSSQDHAAPDSLFGSLRPLGGWLRRALGPELGR
jgi:hypothetical protein